MYAIVDIAGQQFKVEKNKKMFVHRLEDAQGENVEFDKILLIDEDGKVKVGNPIVKDMVVKARVLEHVKGDKVLVFKKKRRKGYQKMNGHRQYMTEIEILDITAGTKAEKVAAPKAAVKKDEVKAEAKEVKAEVKAEAKAPKASTADKKPAAKKTETAKKPVAKKAAAPKKPAAKKDTDKDKE